MTNNYITLVNVSILENARCIYRCVNGRCVNENNTFVCSCYSGYAGKNCSESKIEFDYFHYVNINDKKLKTRNL